MQGHAYTCMRGDSTQTVDSGGVEWQGESGRDGGGDGPDDDDRDGSTAVWRGLDVVTFCVAGLLIGYVVRGAVRGWSPLDRQLAGLVLDGWHFFAHGQRGRATPYEALPPTAVDQLSTPAFASEAAAAAAPSGMHPDRASSVDEGGTNAAVAVAAVRRTGEGSTAAPRQKLRKKKKAGASKGAGGTTNQPRVSRE
jgi:hypothetical protein